MRTIKRQPDRVTTDAQDVKSLAKYFNQMEYKGILEDDNIYAIDQQSFRDAENVYVDWNERLVSRPTLQASNEEQTYNIVEHKVYGDVTIEVRQTIVGQNTTYTVVATKGTNTSSITGLTKYKLAHIEHYIICFNNIGAKIFDTVTGTAWENFTNYSEIPVVNRYVGSIHKKYLEAVNKFIPDARYDEYEWAPTVPTILPTSGFSSIESVTLIGETDTYNYSSTSTYDIDKAIEYRAVRPTNIKLDDTRIADEGLNNVSSAISQTGVILCIAHTDNFECSFNGGKTLTKVWYPNYTGRWLKIASISEDGEYFFFVTTDGVYRCNLGDFTWAKFTPDTSSLPIGLQNSVLDIVTCYSYKFKTGDIFAFYVKERNPYDTTDDYIGRLYMKGPGLYMGTDYTQDYTDSTIQDPYKFGFIEKVWTDVSLPDVDENTDRDGNTALFSLGDTYSYDDKRRIFIEVNKLNNGKDVTSITLLLESYDGGYSIAYIHGGDTSYITGSKYVFASAKRLSQIRTYDYNYAMSITSSISKLSYIKVSTNYYISKIDATINIIYTENMIDHPTGNIVFSTGEIVLSCSKLNITNLTGYRLTNTQNLSESAHGQFSLNFTSNNNSYSTINIIRYYDEDDGIEYNSTKVLYLTDSEIEWVNDAYKIIDITGGTSRTNSELIRSLGTLGIYSKYNATSQTYEEESYFNAEFHKLSDLAPLSVNRLIYPIRLPYRLSNAYLINGIILSDYSEGWKDVWKTDAVTDYYTSGRSYSSWSRGPVVIKDYFYLFDNTNRVWTNNLWKDDTVTIKYKYGDRGNYTEVPDVTYSDTNMYLAFDKTLQITENTKNKNDPTRIDFYLPAKNNQSFIESITALQNISTTEVAIFFKNAIKICSITEDDNVDVGYRYDFYNTKLSTGVRLDDDVINTLEGTYTIFPTRRGLAAMNYQAFMATTDQSIEYLTDNVIDMWTKFYDDSEDGGKTIKILQWRNRLLFTNQTGSILIFDLVTKAWWRWTVPVNIRSMLTDQLTLQLLNMPIAELQDAGTGRIMTFKESTDETEETLYYYDFSENRPLSKENRINWFVMSQPLHMNTPQYYKNLKQLVFQFSESNDPDLTVEKSINAQIKLYRKTITLRRPEIVNFKIENLRTFVKRFNYWKINEVQWALGNDANSSKPHKFELNGISIKYELGEEVR